MGAANSDWKYLYLTGLRAIIIFKHIVLGGQNLEFPGACCLHEDFNFARLSDVIVIVKHKGNHRAPCSRQGFVRPQGIDLMNG